MTTPVRTCCAVYKNDDLFDWYCDRDPKSVSAPSRTGNRIAGRFTGDNVGEVHGRSSLNTGAKRFVTPRSLPGLRCIGLSVQAEIDVSVIFINTQISVTLLSNAPPL